MSPHFHARDIARYRIAASKGLVVLSSATPSIESYSLAKAGKYKLVKLDKRFGNAELPDVEVVDMRNEVQNGNSGIISNLLYERVLEALKTGHQAILLLNRRGFNTYISCPSCGNVVTCDNCSISMTYHSANNRLMCHYCGKSVPFASKCPVCGCESMKYTGIGTQKAEEELRILFSEAKILRMDADSTMTRQDYEKHLKSFADGEFDILLGTQMVAKGLNFPKVTVVGVMNADSSMNSSDFRSYERTFSLLTQVVGRSGRGDDHGTAVIQTNNPESKLISVAAAQDYETFYESEILSRKLLTYPPYCDIASVGFLGEDRSLTEKAAFEFLNILKTSLTDEYSSVKTIVLGPTTASVVKVNNKYRYKLIIKYRNSKDFRAMMNSVFEKYMGSFYAKKVTAYIDVNPDSII
jgi:primosomal protein N' (replication factor Y)